VEVLARAVPQRATTALIGISAGTLAFLVGNWSQTHERYSLLLACAPLVLVFIARPRLPLLLGLATLPVLAVGVRSGGVQLTASDMFLTLAFVGALLHLLLDPTWRDRGRDLGLLLLCTVPMVVWLVPVAVVHRSVTTVANTVQTYQLFLVPLVVGAVVLTRSQARVGIWLFVAASVGLALTWITTNGQGLPLSGNKNPAGQFLANAAILVLALAPGWRSRLSLLVTLGVGIVFTQSRGALLGAGVGIALVLLLRGLGSWRRTLAVVLPLVVLVVVGYQLLPEDVLARSTDFSTATPGTSLGDVTAAQRSVQIRETYSEQGWALVDEYPVFGVGPGNYQTGTIGTDSFTQDPHNLVIRTAGDLGLPGLASFAVMVLGTAYVAFRRRSINPYAAVAIAVQAAVLVHGLVDVYWVRGTPVLPWLLLGLAVNRRLDSTRD
jgi:hypothetical protein